MSTVKLGGLIAEPGVFVGTDPDPWAWLAAEAPSLPVAQTVRRALRADPRPHRASLARRVDLLNLGRGAADPGLLLLLAPRAGTRTVEDYRATWVVWGVPRPSVNLFLAPALAGLATAIGETPDPDAARRLIGSKAFSDIDMEMDVKVAHALRPLVYRVYPDASLSEVQHLMLRRRLVLVPVVGRDHEMLGLITLSDVLAHLLPGTERGPERHPPAARDIMQRAVLCVSEDESLIEASHSMVSRQVTRLPVVREGRLVGFLDRGIVLRAFAEEVVVPPATNRG